MAQPLLVKRLNWVSVAWQVVFWFVALGGLAKLLDNCHQDVAGDGGQPVAFGFAEMSGASSAQCTAQYSWYFWILFFQLICTAVGAWAVRLNTQPAAPDQQDAADGTPAAAPAAPGPLSPHNKAFVNKICSRMYTHVTCGWSIVAYDACYHAVLTDGANAGGWHAAYNCVIAGASMTLLANFVFLATFDVEGVDTEGVEQQQEQQQASPRHSYMTNMKSTAGGYEQHMVSVHAIAEAEAAHQQSGSYPPASHHQPAHGNPLYYAKNGDGGYEDERQGYYDEEMAGQQAMQMHTQARSARGSMQQQAPAPQQQQQQAPVPQQQQQARPVSPRDGPGGPGARQPSRTKAAPVDLRPSAPEPVDRPSRDSTNADRLSRDVNGARPRSPARAGARVPRALSGTGGGIGSSRTSLTGPPQQGPPMNEDRIRGAVDFLTHPSVRAMTDLAAKRKFLEPKGLTPVELEEAMRRAGC
ncbi:hypothetical protein FOA52_008191 [Chlamydomonas sp. UWO 241]|nr:hypothetical protein FOA52_008191 [Chlamydomonas sp. UWO 241]